MILSTLFLLFTIGGVLASINDAVPRPSTFTLTVFQPKLTTLSPSIPSQLAALRDAAAAASAASSNLLVVPELYLTGYNLDAALSPEPHGGPHFTAASEIAAEFNISIVFTYAELGSDDNKTYDSAVLFGRDGTPRLNYRKVNLASGENLFLSPGGVIGPVIDVDGIRVGIIICFDVFLPEPARILAIDNVDLIIIPTANGYPPFVYNQISDLIVPARALENSAFVAYVNWVQVGAPPNPFPEIWSFYGRTTVAEPGGAVLYRGPSDAQDIAHVVLNISAGSGSSTALNRQPPNFASPMCPSNLSSPT